jgi:hypothetical protein
MFNGRINDIIIDRLYPEDNDFILAYDPDSLLAAEDIADRLSKYGFSILNHDDPEIFRYYYEENIRDDFSRGKKPGRKILIRYSVPQTIPYDIQIKCFSVELTLREIFPGLSYSVIKELYDEVFDSLYNAYKDYNGPRLGDKGTKEFILKNVYGIIPEAINDFQQLVKVFIPLYYKGLELPPIIAGYAMDSISRNRWLKQFPIRAVISGKGACFHFIQEQWEAYLRYFDGETADNALIDFDDFEIRAYIDNLFLENYLSPVRRLEAGEYPAWMRSGVAYDAAGGAERRYESRMARLLNLMENIRSYRDWYVIAALWGEILLLKHNRETGGALDDRKFDETGKLLKESFKAWLFGNYGMLASLSYAKAPVMVHKIPWHINHRFPKQANKKVAMLVMDGMSLDDWYVIKEVLNAGGEFVFEEAMCFAWIPTMTSVSRQAIFSGEIPASFSDTILSTNHDDRQWKKFWKNAGYADGSVAFKRNIKEFDEEGLEDLISDDKLRVLGLVINMVDDIMHGQQLSTEGMHQDIRLWAKKGGLRRFIEKLISGGFEIFIASDHGNIGAIGRGTLQEGAAVESPGERARFYNSGLNCDTIISEFKAIRWTGTGLPQKYSYLLAEGNSAFVKEGRRIVTHGGLAIEEVIVPFIHMRKGEKDA